MPNFIKYSAIFSLVLWLNACAILQPQPLRFADYGQVRVTPVNAERFSLVYKTNVNTNVYVAEELAVFQAAMEAQARKFVYFEVSDIQRNDRVALIPRYMGPMGYFDRRGIYRSCFMGSPFYRGGYPYFTYDGWYGSADCGFETIETVSRPVVTFNVTGYATQNEQKTRYDTAVVLAHLWKKFPEMTPSQNGPQPLPIMTTPFTTKNAP